MDQNKKPTLSDVLNAIISSVSKGRQIADFEALRMAMAYQKVELLKGLPIPRMRINNVKVSIPMILSGVNPGRMAQHAPVKQIAEFAANAFEDEVNESIYWINNGIARLELEDDKENIQYHDLQDFKRMLESVKSQKIKSFDHLQKDLNHRLANDLAIYKFSMNGMLSGPGLQKVIGDSTQNSLNVVLKNAFFLWIKALIAQKQNSEFNMQRARNSINDYIKDKIITSLISRVRNKVENTCITEDDVSSDLEVIVDTENIKNAGGGADTVTRLSFVIREEGLEWITEINEDNTSNSKLSAE